MKAFARLNLPRLSPLVPSLVDITAVQSRRSLSSQASRGVVHASSFTAPHGPSVRCQSRAGTPRASDVAVPRVADTLLNTYGRVLWVAPRSAEWASGASSRVAFLAPDTTRDDLLDRLRRDKPTAIVVGDQMIDKALIEAWRLAAPDGRLVLLRRGSSLDKINQGCCEVNGIDVVNLPGVNAMHVADYIVASLRDTAGDLPVDVRMLGCGRVGRQVVAKVLDARSDACVSILVRGRTTMKSLGLESHAARVSITCDLERLLDGAGAVVVCLPVNDQTTNCLDAHHVAKLRPDARIVCVSKPDVFSDAALSSLSRRLGVALFVDYGAATLHAFQRRTLALGCPLPQWRNVPRLTSLAATGPACQRDLDYGAAVKLATAALGSFVASCLSESLAVPTAPAPGNAAHAVVVGRGINGLFQALMLRLAGYRVTVHGGRAEADGASHKGVNMRHLSATETTAKPVHNQDLLPGNAELVVASNRGGIELFRKLLEDNPVLRPLARECLVRAYPHGVGGREQGMALQRRIAMQNWPSGRAGTTPEELTGEELARSHRTPKIAAALRVPGYDLEFRKFMDVLAGLLERAGVVFTGRHLTPDDLALLCSSGETVVTAMGIAERSIEPVAGWFLQMQAIDGEAEDVRGLKLQYELPIGVMNCRRDGDNILVSGGQVPVGSSGEEAEQIKMQFLDAVARHFPASLGHARAAGALQLTPCDRPGSRDGLSRVEWVGPHQIMAGATYAAGTTQGLLWAALVKSEVLRRQGVSHGQTLVAAPARTESR